MIDERINKSLTDLEEQLKNINSARKQVENTISSFDELSRTTTGYVNSLNAIQSKLKELIELVGEDYKSKVKDFEKERVEIINSMQSKLKLIILVNIITLILVVVFNFMR